MKANSTGIAVALAAGMALAAIPGMAQRGNTVQQVADGFVAGVELCVRSALAGVPIQDLPEEQRSGVTPADPGYAQFNRVPPDRPAYELAIAPGGVIVAEPEPGQCEVTTYGPPIRPLFARVARSLTGSPFQLTQTRETETPSDILRDFEGIGPTGRIVVELNGGEPGMVRRLFRFPLASAFVRWSSPETPPKKTPSGS